MNEAAEFYKENAVRFERLLPVSIDRVWELLTDVKLLKDWYGNGRIESRLGGTVRIMDGHIRGTVTHWSPPRKLAYSWNVFGAGDTESPYPESHLTLELEKRDAVTLLTLTHFPVLERFMKQNAMGWHTFLDMLAAAARGETPAPRSQYAKQNAERYGVDLSNLVR